jgi:4-aminobutyrate aminotransferase
MKKTTKKYVSLASRGNKVLSPALSHYFDLEITSGKGNYLIGRDGQKYLDFATGIAACNVGHCHPRVVAAIKKQSEKLIHACSGIVYYEPNIALAEKLAKIVPIKDAQTFFSHSGSESIEGAIKLARFVTKKPGLIALSKGFHGRTFGSLSLTSSKEQYRLGYEPLLPECYIAEKDLDSIKKIVDGAEKGIAAVVIELEQGEGGYQPLDKKFVKDLRAYTQENGILLIVDEVQTGFGRTGKMFACEHYGIVPDIMALAKAIASGLPLGAVVASREIMQHWNPGAHGSTMTGNPVTCAASLATIEIIEKDKLVKNAGAMGALLMDGLKKIAKETPLIKDVRGLGLMIGVEMLDSDVTKKVLKIALEHKLLLISTGGTGKVVRFIPALNITKKEINIALETFKTVLGWIK